MDKGKGKGFGGDRKGGGKGYPGDYGGYGGGYGGDYGGYDKGYGKGYDKGYGKGYGKGYPPEPNYAQRRPADYVGKGGKGGSMGPSDRNAGPRTMLARAEREEA